ncbi:MAG: hypothetical protein N2D54_02620 [Chloroflexota bacterium]
MNSKSFVRLLITLTIATIFGMAFTIMEVPTGIPDGNVNVEDCQGCHFVIRDHWINSGHGQSGLNQSFLSAWLEDGQPSECMQCHDTGYDTVTETWEMDRIDCVVCHSPVNSEHPKEIMPTDISSRLCGDCHISTYEEWESSQHGQAELSCVRCHNPHTTELKTGDAQLLCQTCHQATVHDFGYSTHAENGLLCIDCHLEVSHTEMGDGHGQRLHTLDTNSTLCIDCHKESLHNTTNVTDYDEQSIVSILDLEEHTITAPISEEIASSQPSPPNPAGFAILGTLVGTAFGMLLAPWLEKWYRKVK